MMERALQRPSNDAISSALEDCGWFVQTEAFSPNLVTQLCRQAQNFHQGRKFREAGIVGESQIRHDIRRDEITWLTEAHEIPEFGPFLKMLCEALNQAFFLNLQEFEGHFAHYPPQAFYRGHYDQPRSSSLFSPGTRVISVILYLNSEWQEKDGGELVIWEGPRRERQLARIPPHGGTLVIFRSDSIFHEVLETRADRWSLTGWLRRK